MKRLSLVVFIIFLISFSYANDLLTFKMLNSNKEYYGFDNITLYKTGVYTENNEKIPIEYYTFHSERYAANYVYIDKNLAQLNRGSTTDKTQNTSGSAINNLLGLKKNEDDNDSTLSTSGSNLNYNGNTDYIIQGMVVIDNKANLIYYKSQETLKDYYKQKRTIRVQWDYKNSGYDIDIVDIRKPEGERNRHLFLKSSGKLPIMDNFKSFAYLYLIKNPVSVKRTEIKGLTIFNYAMKKKENTSFNPLYPGEGNTLPPDGKTKFYNLVPYIRKTLITQNNNSYYFDDFDFTLNLAK